MDHCWMKANSLSAKYENGVVEFLEFTKIKFPNNNKGFFYRPCVLCGKKKNLERKKYSIIYVVIEFVKII